MAKIRMKRPAEAITLQNAFKEFTIHQAAKGIKDKTIQTYVKSISDGVYVNRDTMCQGLVNRLYKTAVLRVGGIEVIVASNRVQPWDLEVYRSQGIMPQDKKVLVTKSTAHFRASFGTVAYKILDVEAPGLAPQDPKSLAYQHCPRPIYPLDEI
ncbi:MAG: MlrC C-terminal domain-containing protein [Lachnospiraceae bacterium]|nr:MlrC C-terminal domain-containing protein [Lachnospiraceae bacterium]